MTTTSSSSGPAPAAPWPATWPRRRKRILLLERGDWLPREPQNWSTADVFIDNRYISPDTWYDDKGKAFQPRSTTSWAAPPSCTGRRCTGYAVRTSAS